MTTDAGAGVAAKAPEDGRLVVLDNLRAVLVAWVIGGHAVLGYAAIGGWPYDEVQETTLPPGVELVAVAVLGPTALFVVGTFFFLAGLFAPGQLARRGTTGFVRSRILRLGLPWLLFTALVWPVFMWWAYRAAGRSISYLQAFRGRVPFLDSGPLWFVQVLLYISLGYALWSATRWGRRTTTVTIGGRHLTVAALAIAAASFVVRLWFPARSQQVLDLHLWQWPQLVGMFVLGVLVSRLDWATNVPKDVVRWSAWLLAGTLAALPLAALGFGVTNVAADDAPFLGGWRGQAVALDLAEGLLVVAGSITVLVVAQRHLTVQTRWSSACRRAAYPAYLLQVPVLIALAIALRPLPLPALIKALSVGALGVLGSFWLGWLLLGPARWRANRR